MTTRFRKTNETLHHLSHGLVSGREDRRLGSQLVAGSGALELVRVQGFKKWYARPVMLRYADIRISSAFFRLSGGCSALALQDGK